MKYVLLLGLTYKKFKKNCRITISTGERTIDDVILDDNIYEINPKNFRSISPPDPKGRKKIMDDRTFPSKVFRYELSGDDIKEYITLRIDTNKDNNYNNGFMTKTAEIQIKFIYLIPKIALTRKKYFSMYYNWAEEYMIPKGNFEKIDFHKTILYPGPHSIEHIDNYSGNKKIYIGKQECWNLFQSSLGGSHTLNFHVLKTGKFLKLGTKDCTKHLLDMDLIDICQVYGLINTSK